MGYRKSLEPYYGKIVYIKGMYDGPAKGHEKTGIVFNREANEYPESRENTIKHEDEEECNGIMNAICFPEHTSCLKDVKGYGTPDIQEDHIIIQEDLGMFCNLEKGDCVQIKGIVRKYKRPNGREDYCIKVCHSQKANNSSLNVDNKT